MPQYPNAVVQAGLVAKNGTPNISAPTLLKVGNGYVTRIVVNTAGSAAGGVYDTGSLGSTAAANMIFAIPNTAGVYVLEYPYSSGLVISPGTGQVVTVSWS